MPVIKTPEILRFEKFFIKSGNNCWEWQGARDNKGYGEFMPDIGRERAHITAFRLYKGEVSVGLQIMHSCDNNCCVNPAHLTLGTCQQNMDDAWTRGMRRATHKLTTKDILEIQQIWHEIKNNQRPRMSQTTIGMMYGVHQSEISKIISGNRGIGIMKTNTGFEGESKCQ